MNKIKRINDFLESKPHLWEIIVMNIIVSIATVTISIKISDHWNNHCHIYVVSSKKYNANSKNIS